MKTIPSCLAAIALAVAGLSGGCSTAKTKSPDVAGEVRQSLESAGLKDVSVSQDRDKGVVTLNGNVTSEADKTRAESLAKSFAGGDVVANQIAVLPPGDEKDSKAVNSDLDSAIEKTLHAALIQNQLEKEVKYESKNGVVTLTGTVNSEVLRADSTKIAAAVPNVRQVVNELQVKNQKATSN